MKYVIVEQFGFEVAILGNEIINHNQLVPDGFGVISAGFCNISAFEDSGRLEVGVSVRGKSFSLNKQSRKEDADLIKRTIDFRGLIW